MISLKNFICLMFLQLILIIISLILFITCHIIQWAYTPNELVFFFGLMININLFVDIIFIFGIILLFISILIIGIFIIYIIEIKEV